MKRFYSEVCTAANPDGYSILLDDRIVKTPGKEGLTLPTGALAEAVANEWRAQDADINPDTMPISKLANTAIDRVKPRFGEVAREIANFAGTDMLCYRASEPADLVAKQAERWNPYLVWAKETLNAPLETTTGIMPIQQDQAALATLAAEVFSHDYNELTALHEFTNGFGSIVLALAYIKGFATFDAVWQASIIDQTAQEEAWGVDYDAVEKKENLLTDLKAACLFLSLLRDETTGKVGQDQI